jgi:hypothetical protein
MISNDYLFRAGLMNKRFYCFLVWMILAACHDEIFILVTTHQIKAEQIQLSSLSEKELFH